MGSFVTAVATICIALACLSFVANAEYQLGAIQKAKTTSTTVPENWRIKQLALPQSFAHTYGRGDEIFGVWRTIEYG